MSTRLTATFEAKSWHEGTYAELDGDAKLTRASFVQQYAGDVDGEETIECLMWYRGDGTVHTLALSHFAGRIGDRTGGFVVQSAGGYADGLARSTGTVLPGSGTGEMAGLRGERSTEIGHDAAGSATFDYDLD